MNERHTALTEADDVFRIGDGEQFSILPNPTVALRQNLLT
jgi:hypothetical protein